MVKRYKVVWESEAFNLYEIIFKWYHVNMSYRAADAFRKGIQNTIQLLSTNPYMGIREKKLSRNYREYRSLLSHPHYRIVYYFNDETIYITYLWDNRMSRKDSTSG